MNKKIKAIIFDLGGVLYDIDLRRSTKAFGDLGLKNFDKLYSLKEQTAVFDNLEEGKIGRTEFLKHLRRYLPQTSQNESILDAWRALLVDFPQKNIDILQKIRATHKIYLLSNTNEIHLEAINKYLQQHRGIQDIRDLFDKAFFSFEIGLRKPGEEVFKYVLKDIGLKGDECLFVDDSEANVRGAEKAGITSIYKVKSEALLPVLTPYLS
ncbi:MAG: HAD family phosphatase [Sphingobacteriales bacterium]|nr:MAG: HAD family phosphatase [Sphingobacteriales bacterium]